MKYPKWKYHRDQPGVIVNSHKAEEELGEGWADTPAEFEADAKPATFAAVDAAQLPEVHTHTAFAAVEVVDDFGDKPEDAPVVLGELEAPKTRKAGKR